MQKGGTLIKAVLSVFIIIMLFTGGCGAKKATDGKKTETPAVSTGKSPKEVFKIFVKALEDGSFMTAWDCLSVETKKRYLENPDASQDLVAASQRFADMMKTKMANDGERIEITSAVVTEEKIKDKEAVLKITYTKIKAKTDKKENVDPAATKNVELAFVLTGDGWKIHSPVNGKKESPKK